MQTLSFDAFLKDTFNTLAKIKFQDNSKIQPRTISRQAYVVWHKETGLIVSEDLNRPDIYHVYSPDPEHVPCSNMMYKNKDTIDYSKEFKGYIVGDLIKNGNDWKVVFYVGTPDKFKNYVNNTIKQHTCP